ncbi:MAG TPA: MFS transporter, partial [Edaphobacter sp.]|nr:MFS transporter [Edaphobacter sp.]
MQLVKGSEDDQLHHSVNCRRRPQIRYGQRPFQAQRQNRQRSVGICGLLFFATTLNYMDRQVLALIKPTLQDPVHGIGLTEFQFAAIVSTFSAAYALGLLLFGRFVDKVGTRIGYAVAIAVWTTASLSHSFLSEPASAHALHTVAAFLASLLRHLPGLASAH